MIRLVSACAVALFVARPAQAFVVYDTGSQAKIGCGIPQPQVLHWERSAIPYHLAVDKSGGLDLDDVEDTVKLSFDAWAEPVCFTDGRTLRYDGRVPSATVGFDAAPGAKNVNAVLFVDSGWSHGPGVLGLTTLTYDRCGGVIVDADIELNDQEFDFSVSAVPPTGRTDLRNTVTHEAGHFLGLDHSKLPKATMYAKAPSGETIKRDLEQDDIDGLCSIYEGLATCDVDCDGPSGSTSGGGGGGCAGAGGGAGPAALLLLALTRAFRASRRRPGGAAPAPPR
ncbi:MAG: hypothetical protein AMXMBFR64_37520 [Myxococcales bacterium]